MGRLEFQREQVYGTILNIGCGDDPAGFGAAATHVDLDVWRHPNFIQADCSALPFADGSFDTAVLGDVLEHCVDPEQAIREAARVARRIVITVPEELLLPSVGQHPELGIRMRADHYRRVHGYIGTDDEVIDTHKRTHPLFVRSVPESMQPHDGHMNRFDEAWIHRLIAVSGRRAVVFRKEPEPAMWNWLIVLE